MRVMIMVCVWTSWFVVSGCASPPFSPEDAGAAQSVEFRIDADGEVVEVEYHVSVESVPAAVRTGWRRLYPVDEPTAAEKEYSGGDTFWELAATIAGRKTEAMFWPNGELYEMEIEVAATQVPESVRQSVQTAFPNASSRAWEVIRDGSREVLSWHAKVQIDGVKLKLNVLPDGTIDTVLREAPAEIEVPLAGVRSVAPTRL